MAAAADAPSLEAIAPATGDALGAVPVASPKAVRDAVAEAGAVQGLWAQLRLADRARYMARAAQAVIDEADELADLIAREQGRPRTEVEIAEILPAIETLQWLAEHGPGILERREGRPDAARCTRSRARAGPTSRSASSASSVRRPSRSPRRWATSPSR